MLEARSGSRNEVRRPVEYHETLMPISLAATSDLSL